MNVPVTTSPLKAESTYLPLPILKEIVEGVSLKELCAGLESPGYPDRIGSYQYTHSGHLFFPCDPRPEEVQLEDIAHGLAGLCRFNGQTIQRMTVAEHTYHCSFVGPRQEALERLMHDCGEALIGDLIRPLKIIPLFGAIYLKIESGIERAVAERFKLTYPWPASVRTADETVLKAEIAQNIGSSAPNHLMTPDTVAADVKLQYWTPALAQLHWMDRFKELASERGIDWKA
jgi:hypothetical protein